MKKIIVAFGVVLMAMSTNVFCSAELVSKKVVGDKAEDIISNLFQTPVELPVFQSVASLRPEACRFTNNSGKTIWVRDQYLHKLNPRDVVTVVVPFNVTTYDPSQIRTAQYRPGEYFRVTENCKNNSATFTEARKKYATFRAIEPQ